MSNLPQRFWDKVDKAGDCWLWTASTKDGYGQFYIGSGNRPRAHRLAYIDTHGPIPDDLQIDHICRVRACVNPAHLQPATRTLNLQNHGGPQANSTSGVRGVAWATSKGRWMVTVQHEGRSHHGGYFDSLGDAETAAIDLRNQLHTNNLADRQVA